MHVLHSGEFRIVVPSISILELRYDFSVNLIEAINIRGVNSGVGGKMYNEELQYLLPFAKCYSSDPMKGNEMMWEFNN
jgi:hypothetical protein